MLPTIANPETVEITWSTVHWKKCGYLGVKLEKIPGLASILSPVLWLEIDNPLKWSQSPWRVWSTSCTLRVSFFHQMISWSILILWNAGCASMARLLAIEGWSCGSQDCAWAALLYGWEVCPERPFLSAGWHSLGLSDVCVDGHIGFSCCRSESC